MTTENLASNLSERLLSRLVALGVTDVVVAPGSRSQALALAAARLEILGLIRLHVRVDERSAAFTALGIALETGRPAPVIVTSGTAVLNLIPATAEAHHASVPMVLLTADRPSNLHGVGSSQTTRQFDMVPHLFRLQRDVQVVSENTALVSEGVRAFSVSLADQAWAAAMGQGNGKPGPVQLNLAFTEPLSGDSGVEDILALATGGSDMQPAQSGHESHVKRSVELVADGKTLVVAGHGAGANAALVAEALAAPLIAEVTSGAHFGPNLIVHYRQLLNETDSVSGAGLSAGIERVVVFGVPTLSREVPKLIASVSTVVLATGKHPELFNPTHREVQIADRVVVSEATDGAYAVADRVLAAWVAADQRVARQVDDSLPAPDLELAANTHFKAQAEFVKRELEIDRTPVTRQSLAQSVWQATWPPDRLVLGASQLIRELDGVASGRRVTVRSNRGLAGIDGTLSTAIGVAQTKPRTEPGITRVLLGDLTLLHDMSALFLNPQEEKPRLQVIVGNDGGGKIFDQLEVATTADPAAFDRTIFVQHHQTFADIAQGFGWDYVSTNQRGELDRLLTTPVSGPTIIEVMLER